MHRVSTPVNRKRLVDPAACGVRLGVDLREAAEKRAYSSGMCLSHWIKATVAAALNGTHDIENYLSDKTNVIQRERSAFDAAYEREMEELDDK